MIGRLPPVKSSKIGTPRKKVKEENSFLEQKNGRPDDYNPFMNRKRMNEWDQVVAVRSIRRTGKLLTYFIAGDLTIECGQLLQIDEVNSDGWWRATDEKGRTGIVPSTFLRVVDPKDERIYAQSDALGALAWNPNRCVCV